MATANVLEFFNAGSTPIKAKSFFLLLKLLETSDRGSSSTGQRGLHTVQPEKRLIYVQSGISRLSLELSRCGQLEKCSS